MSELNLIIISILPKWSIYNAWEDLSDELPKFYESFNPDDGLIEHHCEGVRVLLCLRRNKGEIDFKMPHRKSFSLVETIVS